MAYVDFNLDGKVIKMRDEILEEEKGILEEKSEFDKTEEITPLSKEDIEDNTLVDIFGDNHE